LSAHNPNTEHFSCAGHANLHVTTSQSDTWHPLSFCGTNTVADAAEIVL
jgi:hypothetical protein